MMRNVPLLPCVLLAVMALPAPDARAQTSGSLAELLAKAQQQEQAGQIDQAAETRRQAITTLKTDEELAVQWTELANLYARRERPYAEAEALEQSLKHLAGYDPRHWPTVERLLDLYRERLDRPAAAVTLIESLTKGLEPGRGDFRVWWELATTRHGMGDTDWARNVYQALIRRTSPDDAETRRRLGRAVDACKRFTTGDASFNRDLRAAAMLGQFRTRISEKKWAEAVQCMADLLTQAPDVVVDSPGVAGTGTRTIAAALLADTSPEAQRACLEVQAPAVKEVADRGRAEEIEHFAYTHPSTDHSPLVFEAAGDALLAEGRFSRAAARYRQAAALISEATEQRVAVVKAARASILAGEPVPDGLPLGETVVVAGEQMTVADAIRGWQAEAGTHAGTDVAMVPLSAMKPDRLRLLQAPLALRKWQAGWQAVRGGGSPVMTPAFIPYVLSGDRSQVFINTSEMVYAIDPVGETLLWARGPSELLPAELLPPSLEKVNLLNTPKRFHTATSADAVFFRLNWAHRTTLETRSAIFAARREDGALRWSTESLPELKGMRFASDPAYADGTVVAAVWEPREVPVFHLVGLDAVTGELLWKTHLLSGTMFPVLRGCGMMDSPLASPPPAIVDGRVYFAPSVGVLACVDLLDGHVRWLQRYPRICEYGPPNDSQVGDTWSGRFVFNRPNAPIIVRRKLGNLRKLVLVAPQDFRGVFFFDAESGELLRQYQAIDFRVMIGADNERVYVQQGGAAVAVGLAPDPQPAEGVVAQSQPTASAPAGQGLPAAKVAWRTMLPTSMFVGSPALSPRGIICTTREGISVLSPADGRVIEHLPIGDWETVGNALDLGDRIVASSAVTVFVFAKQGNGGENWTTPRSPEPGPLSVEVPAPTGLTRWALPAPDRADFYLSNLAPGRAVLRSWESFQFRQLDPAPTLLWEYPGMGWPRCIQFDVQTVLLDYAFGQLVAIDAHTGKIRWEINDRSMSGERGGPSACLPLGDLVVWYQEARLQGLESSNGKARWGADFPDAIIRGVCPNESGIGVFLESGDRPSAVLLDRKTGKELRRLELLQKRSEGNAPCSVRPARRDGDNVQVVEPIALVAGREIAVVDFAAGRVQFRDLEGIQGGGDLFRWGDVLCVAGPQGLAAAYRLPDLQPLKVHVAGFWCIKDGVQYYANGPRIFAQKLETGEPLWQSRAFTREACQLVGAGDTVLVAQAQGSHRDPGKGRAWVVALDRRNGEVVAEVETLADRLHRTGHQGESLCAFDTGYLYRFGEPQKGTARRIRIQQTRADVEAVGAVKLARDLEAGVLAPPPASRFTPTIDGDLSDWQDAAWTQLTWPDHWLPDHVLLSPARPRRPTSANDLSAAVAIAQDQRFVYLAARVEDDTQDALPGRPLWGGDSLGLVWRTGSERGGAVLALTAAIVDHVPCLEFGEIAQTMRVMPDTDVWPEWLKWALFAKDVPWLRRWEQRATRQPGIRLGARRDDAAGRTVYELAVSVELLPAARDAEPPLLWDVLVNDADGRGREGTLALGASPWQLEHPLVMARWPAFRPPTSQPGRN